MISKNQIVSFVMQIRVRFLPRRDKINHVIALSQLDTKISSCHSKGILSPADSVNRKIKDILVVLSKDERWIQKTALFMEALSGNCCIATPLWRYNLRFRLCF